MGRKDLLSTFWQHRGNWARWAWRFVSFLFLTFANKVDCCHTSYYQLARKSGGMVDFVCVCVCVCMCVRFHQAIFPSLTKLCVLNIIGRHINNGEEWLTWEDSLS